MGNHRGRQGQTSPVAQPALAHETVIPNPKLKLLDQMPELMPLKHYSIRTEPTYCGRGRAVCPARSPAEKS